LLKAIDGELIYQKIDVISIIKECQFEW